MVEEKPQAAALHQTEEGTGQCSFTGIGQTPTSNTATASASVQGYNNDFNSIWGCLHGRILILPRGRWWWRTTSGRLQSRRKPFARYVKEKRPLTLSVTTQDARYSVQDMDLMSRHFREDKCVYRSQLRSQATSSRKHNIFHKVWLSLRKRWEAPPSAGKGIIHHINVAASYCRWIRLCRLLFIICKLYIVK